MGCEIDLSQERRESTNQYDHHSDELCAREPFEIGPEELLKKESNDDNAHQQGRSGGEID
jgi:hypothetical protein